MAEKRREGRHTGLTLLVLVVGLLLLGVYVLWNRPATGQDALQYAATPATVEAPPDEALKELRATEQAILTTYGWVDRAKGVVRIPIERAIELLAQRGLPARQPNQPSEVF